MLEERRGNMDEGDWEGSWMMCCSPKGASFTLCLQAKGGGAYIEVSYSPDFCDEAQLWRFEGIRRCMKEGGRD